MIAEAKPLVEVTKEAIKVLSQEMGIVNTVRFINQFSGGYGNYTEERTELFKGLSVEEIVTEIKRGKVSDAGERDDAWPLLITLSKVLLWHPGSCLWLYFQCSVVKRLPTPDDTHAVRYSRLLNLSCHGLHLSRNRPHEPDQSSRYCRDHLLVGLASPMQLPVLTA